MLIVLLTARQISRQRTAIVAGQQITIRLGPLDESQAAYTAGDGTELRVLAERDTWLQVSDRAGRIGWLNAKNAALFPR
jgi:SH3-like domain-containing protein